MTCPRCGAEVPDLRVACRYCGNAAYAIKPAARPRSGGKVIPFRPRKLKRQRGKRSFKPDRFMWWLISILVLSLLLPYLVPMHL
ncbi:MAG: hypothetical protein K6U87_07920 [Firmicutes bacterium]|jgi:hypothetical protein|nr:hypothetical protein [Bacillota bacterium]